MVGLQSGLGTFTGSYDYLFFRGTCHITCGEKSGHNGFTVAAHFYLTESVKGNNTFCQVGIRDETDLNEDSLLRLFLLLRCISHF